MRNLMPSLSTAPVKLWLALRVSTFCAAVVAFLYEQGGSATRPLAKLFLGPWYNYDVIYYVRIVNGGYETGDVTSNFHPLYPLIAVPLALVTNAPRFSLLTVSSVAGLFLTVGAYRLARLDYDHKTSWTSTALLLCWPASAALFVPYTEALFLMLSVYCLLAARKGRFWCAGMLGGLASLTRQHGILLVLPLVWEMWEFSNRNWRLLLRSLRTWSAVLLVPAGYAIWVVYRSWIIADVRLDTSNPLGLVRNLMISPASYRLLGEHQFTPLAPFKAFTILLQRNVHFSTWGDLTLGLLFLAMFIFGWKRLRASYRLYSLAILIVGFSFYTGTLNPYISLPRHLLPAFPVFMGVAATYDFKRLPVFLLVTAALQALIVCCFVWETWVM